MTMFDFGDGGFVLTADLSGAKPAAETAWNDEGTVEYLTGTWQVVILLKGGQTLIDRKGVSEHVARARVDEVRKALSGKTSTVEATAPAPAKAAPAKKAAARATKKA